MRLSLKEAEENRGEGDQGAFLKQEEETIFLSTSFYVVKISAFQN